MKTGNGILIFCGTLYDTHKIARGRNLSTVALKNNCCTFSTKYGACASQTEWNISLILHLVWLVKCTLTQNKRYVKYVGRWYMLSVVRIHILKQVSGTRYLQKSEKLNYFRSGVLPYVCLSRYIKLSTHPFVFYRDVAAGMHYLQSKNLEHR